MDDIFQWVAGIAAGIVVGWIVLHTVWRAVGAYRIRRAGPRPLAAATHRIWFDRGPADAIDPVHGPGSADLAPAPPFLFEEEHQTGSQPCVSVRDRRGHRWRVKWGHEVRSETFAVRFAWFCGYFAEVTYFISAGTIEGITHLQRARQCIEEDGAFCDARFELDDPAVKKMFEEHSWSWDDNPFVGTHELNGLKIVVMLLSNWDTKDRRDVARGSNTAIFEHRISRWRREARYLLTDWGGSMGRWGSNIATRQRWDVAGFEEQTPQFVTGVTGQVVQFGYTGQRTADIAHNISRADVQWFLRQTSGVTERHLAEALRVSGANDDEAGRFARALIERIRRLREVATA